ncbi:cytochrome b [Paraburkholderia bengalensis]|uniref:Cytochrome b n=1 Tax=Paraburkholderia bengalensis TaxID=2747562 RepID=A0ABU8ITY3_9BURK
MSKAIEQAYGIPARFFHWITAFLLIVQYAIGILMPDVHRDTKPEGLIAWHLTVGVLIVLVVLLRLVWRAAHGTPAELETIPRHLRMLASVTHWVLYALLVAVPLLGWANASSRGWRVALAGIVPLPPLSQQGSSIGHEAGDIHQLLSWVLLALIGLHVCAAVFHHVVLGDNTLRRMLPRRSQDDI